MSRERTTAALSCYLKDRRTALIVLLVASLLLALFRLTYQSIWCDEGSTIHYSMMSLSDLWASNDFTPIGYFLVEGSILKTFGISELTVRILSAISFGLSVPMIYLLTLKLTDSEHMAGLTALMLLVSPFVLFYAQDGRPYSIDLLLTLVELYLCLEIIRNDDRKDWYKYCLVAALTIYFNYLAILPIVCFFVYLFITEYRENRFKNLLRCLLHWLLYIAIICVLCSPILYHALFAVRTVTNMGVWASGLAALMDIFEAFFLTDYLMVIALAVAVVGAIKLFCTLKQKEFLCILFVQLGTLVILVLLSFKMRMVPRYALFCLPVFLIFISGIIGYLEKYDIRKVSLITACAIVLVSAPFVYNYYTTETKADYRGLANEMSQVLEDGDCVIFLPDLDDLVIGPTRAYYDYTSHNVTYLGADNLQDIQTILGAHAYPHYYLIMSSEPKGHETEIAEVIDWIETESSGTLLYTGYCVYLYSLA